MHEVHFCARQSGDRQRGIDRGSTGSGAINCNDDRLNLRGSVAFPYSW
jgi:hypothetical protein